MGIFKLKVSSEDKVKEPNLPIEHQDFEQVYTKIDDLPDDSSGNNLTFHQEDLNLSDPEDKKSKFSWGVKPKMGPGCPEAIRPPEFIPILGSDGVIYIHLNFLSTQSGAFFQFLTSLPPDKVVRLMIHGVLPPQITAVQMAIINSKATIRTKFFMVENDIMEAGIFFTWMVGNVLEPVPYGVISLKEPWTLFSSSSNLNSMARNDDISYDAIIKKKWYDCAANLGLLTEEDIVNLNQGKSILIPDINERIVRANQIKEQGYNPYNPEMIKR